MTVNFITAVRTVPTYHLPRACQSRIDCHAQKPTGPFLKPARAPSIFSP